MLDYIFVVADPFAWHAQNIERNRSHYSFLRFFGPGMMCQVAEHVGVGVYFNTLVPLEGKVVKYGVIGMDAFQQDLFSWSHLYIGGRLQKPDLFKRITSLSYLGDVRMGLAEDSKKVERIVAGSYKHFQQLYMPLLQGKPYQDLGVIAGPDGLQQQDSLEYRVLLARMAVKLGPALKSPVASAAAAVLGRASASVSAQLPQLCESSRQDIAALALRSPKFKRLIKSGLRTIVGNSSRRQAVAGLLYAGPIKSLQYLGRKLAKAWR
eukprot:gene6454-6683_t